ncbi:UNVERIFIED_CONTAM: hypothetical protein PYX00_006126 [Menopon gallinae]|uniref:Carboxylesterase type B domain-containing protein n=1 Tax=Menopon gallinae TaxID=328185 RepID=A0AAW2HV19_9NEOP
MLRCPAKAVDIRVAVILALTVAATVAGPRYSSRIVETKSGSIRGIILELSSKHLEPVEAFRGVPYAAPPVGERRYMPPGPPQSWTGTRLADSFPPVCPQRLPDITNKTLALMNMPRGRYLQLKRLLPLLQNQSEDCLYLNLYVPGSGKYYAII